MDVKLIIEGAKGIKGEALRPINTFVKFKWNGKSRETYVKANTSEPEWSQEFWIKFDASKPNTVLRLELWRAYIVGGAKVPYGFCEVDLRGLKPSKSAKGWYALSGNPGHLKLYFKLYPKDYATIVSHEPKAIDKHASADKQSSSSSSSSEGRRQRAAGVDSLTGGGVDDSDDEVDVPGAGGLSAKPLEQNPQFLRKLTNQFPRRSVKEVVGALEKHQYDFDRAQHELLDLSLKEEESAVTTDRGMYGSPLAAQAYQQVVHYNQPHVQQQHVQVVYSSEPSRHKPHYSSDQSKKIAGVKKIFPHVTEKRIYSALQAAGWKKSKAVDILIEDQITTLAMTHKAQNMSADAMKVIQHIPSHQASYFGYHDQHKDDQHVHHQQQVGLHVAATVAHNPGQFITHSGRRKALLIGINYRGSKRELRGCVPDVNRFKKLITNVYGFPDHPNAMTILCDDTSDPRTMPTKRNILLAIDWLVKDARRGDALFFHFSGHGSQTVDHSGDESSGYDNTILPVDYQSAGAIVDDELHERLVESLSEGVKLTAVMDCCHSGTGMDLPFSFDRHNCQWKTEYNPKFCPADVLMLSGCKDEETSSDVMIPSKGSGGALSMALLSQLTENPYNLVLGELVKRVYTLMQSRGFRQQPQLSSTQKLPSSHKFSLTTIVPNLNPHLGREHAKKPKKAMHAVSPQHHQQAHQYHPHGAPVHAPAVYAAPVHAQHVHVQHAHVQQAHHVGHVAKDSKEAKLHKKLLKKKEKELKKKSKGMKKKKRGSSSSSSSSSS